MTRAKRTKPQPQADLDKIWRVIGRQRTAMLITRAEDRLLDTRPMACLQPDFDGHLWFLTSRHSDKLREIGHDHQVLVCYAKPSSQHVAVCGRARLGAMARGLRVWFPSGHDDPELALLEVKVERVHYWTRPASMLTYALGIFVHG